MRVTVGTFNLNNLFSRYNFRGEIEAIQDDETSVDSDVTYVFADNQRFRIRTFMGKLVKGKDDKDRLAIIERIRRMDIDVLAVQEVEDIDTLRWFNRDDLQNLYPYQIVVEGNDPRLIDLGVMSKYPIGGVTSWQNVVHPDDRSQPVFGRDLLEVEVYDLDRSRRLFTLYNNHLKSHYRDFRVDQDAAERKNNLRRLRQSQMVAQIVEQQMRPNSSYIIVGDMNDPADSEWLRPFSVDANPPMINALENAVETRPAKADNPMPITTSWTHRFKESGLPARYDLFDQIWISPALADNLTGAWIDRRTKHSGDGSDHDPAWIELDL